MKLCGLFLSEYVYWQLLLIIVVVTITHFIISDNYHIIVGGYFLNIFLCTYICADFYSIFMRIICNVSFANIVNNWMMQDLRCTFVQSVANSKLHLTSSTFSHPWRDREFISYFNNGFCFQIVLTVCSLYKLQLILLWKRSGRIMNTTLLE